MTDDAFNARLLVIANLLEALGDDVAAEGGPYSLLDSGYMRAAQTLVESQIDPEYEPWRLEEASRPDRRLRQHLATLAPLPPHTSKETP